MKKTWKIRRKEAVGSKSFHQYSSSGVLSFLGQFFPSLGFLSFYSHLSFHPSPYSCKLIHSKFWVPPKYIISNPDILSFRPYWISLLLWSSVANLLYSTSSLSSKTLLWLTILHYTYLSKTEINVDSPSLSLHTSQSMNLIYT